MTFVLGPLPLLAVCWIVMAFGVVGVGKSIAYVGEHWFGLTDEMWQPQDHLWAQASMMVAVSWVAIVFPPLAVAGLLCRIARRNALSWRWPIVACTLLALVAGCLTVSYQLAVQPNDGRFMFGFGFSGSVRGILLNFLPKFAPPRPAGTRRHQTPSRRIQAVQQLYVLRETWVDPNGKSNSTYGRDSAIRRRDYFRIVAAVIWPR